MIGMPFRGIQGTTTQSTMTVRFEEKSNALPRAESSIHGASRIRSVSQMTCLISLPLQRDRLEQQSFAYGHDRG